MGSCEEMNSIIYMDPVLYKAAAAGDVDPFENDQTCLDRLLTPDESTILHVYLRNQRGEPGCSTDFVDEILERCPPLLLQTNKKGEIPLHLAAKYGHSNVVKVLIHRAKAPPADPESGVTAAQMMMRMTNGEGETALHEAARNARSHVVKILTREDPDFSYSANVHGETPLYIAASVGRRPEQDKVIDEILRNCISVDYGGPNGRTALHAAITAGDHETIRKILEREKQLTKTTDENGWSSLHYAAYFSRWSAVNLLLQYDASAAYIAETEKKRTALHIAAIQGCVVIMKEIVSHCPGCCELVDKRGWGALHYAVASKDSKVFEECLRRIPELERLKTEKNDEGNTPFHLIAALTHKLGEWREVYPDRYGKSAGIYGLNKQELSIANIYSGDFGEIQKDIVESLEDVGSGPFGYGPFLFPHRRDKNREEEVEQMKKNIEEEVEQMKRNREEEIEQMKRNSEEEIQQMKKNKEEEIKQMKRKREEEIEQMKKNIEENKEEIEQRMKNREEALNKARESHLVVAALIATVTFAAAFTLPGGYKSDQGTAILAKKAAFIVFLISDALSMVLSISAVFIHFCLAFYQGFLKGNTRVDETTWKLFKLATLFTMIGMGTMIISFITGTYAVLEPVLGLAINICLIGLSFFFLACGIIYKDLRYYI